MPTKKAPIRKKVVRKKKPQLHRFEKVVVTEGTYSIPDENGKFKTVEVTPEKIKSAANTFKKMKDKGIKVPAPWKHDFEVNAFHEGNDGLLEDSSKNAGFWDSLSSRVNEDGKTEMVAVVEVPGDPEDPNTPAGKVGTSVKETSIYLRGKHELTDGSKEVLKDVPMHIALVTHPIESGQGNFELKDPDYSIAMSQLVVDTDMRELADLFARTVKVFIPPNLTLEDLPSTLMIALRQKELAPDDGSGDVSKVPETLTLEPIIMSNLSQEQVDALLKAKAVNPDTGEPFTEEELKPGKKSDPPKKKEEDLKKDLVMSAMSRTMETDRKKSYRDRTNRLIESGQTTKEFADSNIFPKIEAYGIGFTDDGDVQTPAVEELIMSLETIPPRKAGDNVDLDTIDPYDLGLSEDEEKEMDQIADDIVGSLFPS